MNIPSCYSPTAARHRACRSPAAWWSGWRSALAAWWVIRVLQSEDLEQGAEWRYDVSRINELRRLDLFYRAVPAGDPAASPGFNRKVFRDGLPGHPARNPGGRAAAVLAARRIPGQGAN